MQASAMISPFGTPRKPERYVDGVVSGIADDGAVPPSPTPRLRGQTA